VPLLAALGGAALLLGGAFIARRRRVERVPVPGPTAT
jgi:LPXTG-motif cell wall-anchored protein